MSKIIGNTIATPMAIPDWNQTDEKKADYIKNKPELGALALYDVIASTSVTHNEDLLSTILETYILNIDYDTLLAFDTSEIVTGATSTTSVLGQAVLGQMVLA
jgi:hypothetical protein